METTDVETVEATQRATQQEQEMGIEKEQTASPPPPSAKQEIASLREVFYFARTPRTRLCIGLAFCCAVVSGSVFPGQYNEILRQKLLDVLIDSSRVFVHSFGSLILHCNTLHDSLTLHP
jgi:hypothetical protein